MSGTIDVGPASDRRSVGGRIGYGDDNSEDVQYVYGPPVETRGIPYGRGGRVTMDVDASENPLCPRIGGLCCLLLLFNLALALICLGFVVVVQLPADPAFIWWVGLFMLIFGFVTLVGSFLYCYVVCRRHRIKMEEREAAGLDENDPRWTHHWSKTIRFGNEINYENDPTEPPRR